LINPISVSIFQPTGVLFIFNLVLDASQTYRSGAKLFYRPLVRSLNWSAKILERIPRCYNHDIADKNTLADTFILGIRAHISNKPTLTISKHFEWIDHFE